MHVVRLHRRKKRRRATDIVRVVVERSRDGIADGLQSGKVNDGIDAEVAKDAIERRGITNVGFDKAGPDAANCRNPIDDSG
jgi:hypothetical protein